MVKETLYISVAELAQLLGISRVAVFKRIKKGEIKAEKIGRSYAISRSEVNDIIQAGDGKKLTTAQKEMIEKAVGKTIKEYGETLRLLGKE